MTDYVRIPIRENEHKRLVALQTQLAGKIDSYLARPSLSDVIKYLLDQQEIKNMTTNIVTLKFVAQSGHAWEETIDADDIDTTVEQTVATHGDIERVEQLADPNDASGETIWRFE